MYPYLARFMVVLFLLPGFGVWAAKEGTLMNQSDDVFYLMLEASAHREVNLIGELIAPDGPEGKGTPFLLSHCAGIPETLVVPPRTLCRFTLEANGVVNPALSLLALPEPKGWTVAGGFTFTCFQNNLGPEPRLVLAFMESRENPAAQGPFRLRVLSEADLRIEHVPPAEGSPGAPAPEGKEGGPPAPSRTCVIL